MHDASTTIHDFLSATASKQPTPGGGSVAAMAGALAAAMGEMVFAYSVGKKDLVAYQTEFEHTLSELRRARSLLLQLLVEDQHAFADMTAAKKLPADDPKRQSQLDAAIVACIRVPQAIGATAVAIVELCERSVGKVNKYLLSDLAVCAELAMATARSATYNVRVNLPELANIDDRKRLMDEQAAMIARAVEIMKRVMPAIWKRVES